MNLWFCFSLFFDLFLFSNSLRKVSTKSLEDLYSYQMSELYITIHYELVTKLKCSFPSEQTN